MCVETGVTRPCTSVAFATYRKRAAAGLRLARIDAVGVDPQLTDRLDQLAPIGATGQAQPVERRVGDLLGAHLEVHPERLAGVAAAEAIGPEHGEGPVDPARDHVRE